MAHSREQKTIVDEVISVNEVTELSERFIP